ncbi:MAG: hypothetical protein WDN75_20910 [Bacteroidota bacterium]
MKKLEDIPKKDFFSAPEGYFDRLPEVVQSRVAESKREPAWVPYFRNSLKYALPVIVIGVASFFYFNKTEAPSTEEVLASIDSGQLIAYLEDNDEVSSEDLLENVPLDNDEAAAIHQGSMEIGIDDDALEDLSNELGVDY